MCIKGETEDREVDGYKQKEVSDKGEAQDSFWFPHSVWTKITSNRFNLLTLMSNYVTGSQANF
jgi:hypothetical protein